jgi:hypothetical protein
MSEPRVTLLCAKCGAAVNLDPHSFALAPDFDPRAFVFAWLLGEIPCHCQNAPRPPMRVA